MGRISRGTLVKCLMNGDNTLSGDGHLLSLLLSHCNPHHPRKDPGLNPNHLHLWTVCSVVGAGGARRKGC